MRSKGRMEELPFSLCTTTHEEKSDTKERRDENDGMTRNTNNRGECARRV